MCQVSSHSAVPVDVLISSGARVAALLGHGKLDTQHNRQPKVPKVPSPPSPQIGCWQAAGWSVSGGDMDYGAGFYCDLH